MFIVGLLSWWYGAGWKAKALREIERLASLADYFSFGLLIKTLFSPFRQISAGKVNGSIGVQWRAFVDRLISRMIGAVVRSMVLIIGCIALVGFGLFGVIGIIIWPLIPFAPFVGAIMMIIGWTPSWR